MAGRRAFSLAELVFAVGLLALMLLGVAAFFTRFLGSVAKQDDLAAGRAFAQRTLDEVVAFHLYGTSSAPLAQGVYSHDSKTQTTFFYQLTSSSAPLGASTGDFLTVKVTWWSGDTAPRAGVGRLALAASRLVTPP